MKLTLLYILITFSLAWIGSLFLVIFEMCRATRLHECNHCERIFSTSDRGEFLCPECREKQQMKEAA